MRILLALTLLIMTTSPSYAEGLEKSLEELKAETYTSDRICKEIGNKAIVMYRAYHREKDETFKMLEEQAIEDPKGVEDVLDIQEEYQEHYYDKFYRNVMLYDALGCNDKQPLAGLLSCASKVKEITSELCTIP